MEENNMPVERHKPAPRKLLAKVAAVVLPVAVLGGAIVLSIASADASARSAASASMSASAAEAAASASAEASASRDAQAAADAEAARVQAVKASQSAAAQRAADDRTAQESVGWKYIADYLYYESDDSAKCPTSSYGCEIMHVLSMKGCPGGMFVDVTFYADSGVQVSNSTRATGALGRGAQAVLVFEDTSRAGTKYRVDSAECY